MNRQRSLRENLIKHIRQALITEENVRGSWTLKQDATNEPVLGAVVRRLLDEQPAQDLHPSPHSDLPVPLHEVAAFVDGSLTDIEKQNQIARTALSDPGLLMEIVAAIHSNLRDHSPDRTPATSNNVHPHAPPQLTNDVKDRLLSLQSLLPPGDGPALQPSSVTASPNPPEAAAMVSAETPNHLAAEPAQRSGRTPRTTPRTQAPPQIEIARTAPAAHSHWGHSVIAALAALLLIGVAGWWWNARPRRHERPIAEERNVARPETGKPLPNESPAAADAFADDGSRETRGMPKGEPAFAVQDDDLPGTDDDLPGTGTPTETPLVEIDRPLTPARPEVVTVDAAAQPGGELDSFPRPGQPGQAMQLVGHWKEIDGLLLTNPTEEKTADSQSADAPLSGVASGESFRLARVNSSGKRQWRTPPLCRAVASLDGGGTLVLASDTQLEWSVEGTLDLQFGAIALVGLPPDMVIRVGRTLRQSVPLQTTPKGDIVMEKTLEGFQIDVAEGAAVIAGHSFADTRVSVEGPRMAVQSAGDAPERLPRWTRERVDRIEVGRTVLAQLSESKDVQATLLQTLRRGDVRGEAAATLRGWLVASSQDNLMRLIASDDPLIRESALQYWVSIHPRDARHRGLWNHLQSRAVNPRILTVLRSFFVDLWAGRRPQSPRRDELLRLLQASDAATRATAHFLLRSFYGNGPAFDPNASAQMRTRTVNAWRVIINRAAP